MGFVINEIRFIITRSTEFTQIEFKTTFIIFFFMHRFRISNRQPHRVENTRLKINKNNHNTYFFIY